MSILKLIKAKIIKALSLIIDQNISLLKLPLVESTIYQCIHNSSKLIREAVIDLMGKFIQNYLQYPTLSIQYYQIIINLINDDGLSVK